MKSILAEETEFKDTEVSPRVLVTSATEDITASQL